MSKICDLVQEPADIIFLISVAILISGMIILAITGIIACKQKKMCCFQAPYEPEGRININDLSED